MAQQAPSSKQSNPEKIQLFLFPLVMLIVFIGILAIIWASVQMIGLFS